MQDIAIRLETKKDHKAVGELTREAFWNVYVPGASGLCAQEKKQMPSQEEFYIYRHSSAAR
jgi:predicted N-acetyltransferase YhbS